MKILRNSILYIWATGVGIAQVSVASGWTVQGPSQATGNTLRAVAALDFKTIIAVGEQGSILRTTDAGLNWKLISSGISAELSGVSFADANTGIAVGSDGFILRTLDGGSTWTSQASGTTDWLRAASFSEAGTATVAGEGGTILRSTDGRKAAAARRGSSPSSAIWASPVRPECATLLSASLHQIRSAVHA